MDGTWHAIYWPLVSVARLKNIGQNCSGNSQGLRGCLIWKLHFSCRSRSLSYHFRDQPLAIYLIFVDDDNYLRPLQDSATPSILAIWPKILRIQEQPSIFCPELKPIWGRSGRIPPPICLWLRPYARISMAGRTYPITLGELQGFWPLFSNWKQTVWTSDQSGFS